MDYYEITMSTLGAILEGYFFLVILRTFTSYTWNISRSENDFITVIFGFYRLLNTNSCKISNMLLFQIKNKIVSFMHHKFNANT